MFNGFVQIYTGPFRKKSRVCGTEATNKQPRTTPPTNQQDPPTPAPEAEPPNATNTPLNEVNIHIISYR